MKETVRTGLWGVTIPFNILFPTSEEATWVSVCENSDAEEVALTKRSDRDIVDLVDLVATLIGLHGAIADDTSHRVGFGVLEASRRNCESSKVIVDVVAGFNDEVWGEMVIEVAASGMGGGLCGVTIDDTSTKGELFNA